MSTEAYSCHVVGPEVKFKLMARNMVSTVLPHLNNEGVAAITDILKGVLIAVVAAWLAVRRSIHEFSSQRWWDRQEEAYRRIIECLSKIKFTLSRMGNMRAEYNPPECQRARWDLALEKLDELATISHEGAFRVSRAANQAVGDLLRNWYRAIPVGEDLEYQELLDRYANAIETCRNVVDLEARKALRLPPQR
jgi:hypothetical protein